jgi:DNA (cytosine-5)-methyltransferase 1
MSLGFQRAGYDLIGAFENWKPAINIYRANFNHKLYEVDLSKIADYSIISDLNPDLIIGGPPCQDFSIVGKRDENNGRGILTVAYAEIIKHTQPEWFVMENVPRIEKSQKLKTAKRISVEAGYGLTEVVLNACYCGVPQRRKRYFLIGRLKEPDHFMDGYFAKNRNVSPMSVYDYLGDSLQAEHFYVHPRRNAGIVQE